MRDFALLFVFEWNPGNWSVALLSPVDDQFRCYDRLFSTPAEALAQAKEKQALLPWSTCIVGCDPRLPRPANLRECWLDEVEPQNWMSTPVSDTME